MWTSSFSVTVGKIMKHLFVDRLKKHHHRPLDNFILKGGFAYGPFLSIVFFQPCTHYRRGLIPPIFQAVIQILQTLLQVFPILLSSYPINAWGAILACMPVGLSKKINIDVMRQRREYHLRIVLCLFRNPLKFR